MNKKLEMMITGVTWLLLLVSLDKSTLAGADSAPSGNQINFIFGGMIPPSSEQSPCPPNSPCPSVSPCPTPAASIQPYSISDAVFINVVSDPYYSSSLNDTTYLTLSGSGPYWEYMNGIYGYRIPANTKPYYNIIYTNLLHELSIIHAHGQTPPANLDGTQYISALPLAPGQTVHYAYPLSIPENIGTYFIHSHFGFQTVRGAAAPLLIDASIDPNHPLAAIVAQAREVVMMLDSVCPWNYDVSESDRGSCNFTQLLALEIENADPVYGPDNGCPSPAEDADYYYADLLANKKTLSDPVTVQVYPGEYVRLRIINAAGMIRFLLRFPFEAMVLATDGHLVKPGVAVEQAWLNVAQRLDMIVRIPPEKHAYYPIIGYGEYRIGQAGIVLVTPGVTFDPSSLVLEQFDNDTINWVNFDLDAAVSAWQPLEPKPVDRVLVFNLTGDDGVKGINGYSYLLPPVAPMYVPNPHPSYVVYGERVMIVINNYTPDPHDMHLHGHVFQLVELNGVAVDGPRRDVVTLPGGCTSAKVIFEANNPGVHLFHCHMHMHFAAGMATTIEYLPSL